MTCSKWWCCAQVFAHNDADHLEAVLRASIAEGQPRTRRPWKKVLVVVEGIYSMEGEIVDLAAIVAVAKKYKVRQMRTFFGYKARRRGALALSVGIVALTGPVVACAFVT